MPTQVDENQAAFEVLAPAVTLGTVQLLEIEVKCPVSA